MKRIISLGAGVQSSAMLLMALEGRFGDMPECAVFADTGWEPKETYRWLAALEKEVAPFPIVRLTGRNIRTDASPRETRGKRRFVTLPTYLEGGGMGRRQCTKEFKLAPMQRYWRSLGATAKNPIECWIGISTDEAHRMKPSRVKYAINRFPLLEAGINRETCAKYLMMSLGVVVPKSSCIGCPFHGDGYWATLKKSSPAEFKQACDFDDEIRDLVEASATARMRAQQFLHRSCVPLRQIKEFKHENQSRMFFDEFGGECEGMCGL